MTLFFLLIQIFTNFVEFYESYNYINIYDYISIVILWLNIRIVLLLVDTIKVS